MLYPSIDKLLNIVFNYSMRKEDYLQSALLKWLKTVKHMRCIENSNIIRDFCRAIREKCLNDALDKIRHLADKLIPRQIHTLFKFAKLNDVANIKADQKGNDIIITWDSVKIPDINTESYLRNIYIHHEFNNEYL